MNNIFHSVKEPELVNEGNKKIVRHKVYNSQQKLNESDKLSKSAFLTHDIYSRVPKCS